MCINDEIVVQRFIRNKYNYYHIRGPVQKDFVFISLYKLGIYLQFIQSLSFAFKIFISSLGCYVFGSSSDAHFLESRASPSEFSLKSSVVSHLSDFSFGKGRKSARLCGRLRKHGRLCFSAGVTNQQRFMRKRVIVV